MERKHALIGGGAALGAVLLLTGDGGLPEDLEDVEGRLEGVADRVVEVSRDGELVVDPYTGVFYDDAETGAQNDEAGDDANLSFSDVNDAVDGTLLDPETYLPDVEGDAVAPSGGVLADPGDSMNWGEAGEEENDDLSERAAESNLSDDEKAMFDRLANVDDVSTLDDYNAEPEEETTDSGSTSSGSTSSTSYSYSSGSTSSTSSDEEEEPHDPYAHLYDDGVTGTSSGLVE